MSGDCVNLLILRIFPCGFAAHYAWHYACNKTIGSLSNNISDRNEDVKKAVDMLGKATTLHVHHTYFVHFLVMLHDCNLRMPNFKFYRFFLPLNVDPKSILEKFAHIWRVQWIGINATKFKKGKFILKVTFLLPSPSSMLKLPNNIPSNPTPPYHFWGRGRGG